MADITKERLAELLKYPHNIQVEEVRPLIAMASRCVTIETVRKLAEVRALGDEAFALRHVGKRAEATLVNTDAMNQECAFYQMAKKDLKEAAEALAKEGNGE